MTTTIPATLTLFDLDHTLIGVDSNQTWIAFLVDEGVLARDTFTAGAAAMDLRYRAAKTGVDVEFCNFFAATLTVLPRAELEALRVRFVRERIVPAIAPAGRAAVAAHTEAGDVVAIVTATNRFITAPIAEEFGVPYLIATELELRDGEFTGVISGTPSMRTAKVSRVDEWLQTARPQGHDSRAAFEKIWCYTDSINDIALLEAANARVAVDPDAPLLAEARSRGWPVVNWHH